MAYGIGIGAVAFWLRTLVAKHNIHSPREAMYLRSFFSKNIFGFNSFARSLLFVASENSLQ